MTQIERITKYETMMDKVSASQKLLEKALELFERTDAMSAELNEYLSSEEWRGDYCDDEAGLLPPDLKRGVLSEDGLFDVLDERRALLARMLRICADFLEE